MTRLQHIRAVLWGVLLLNLGVALAKLIYGLLTNALSMQADGFHSFFDGISNVVGLVGIWMASKPPDMEHPYGHKKFESLAAGGIGLMLVATCVYLLARTYAAIGHNNVPQVTPLSFGIMVVTMIVNATIAIWERRKGTELQSDVLIADSHHTASDVLVSLSVIAGLMAVRFGYPLVDPLVSLFIAGVIAWIGANVLRGVLHVFIDTVQLDPEAVRETALSIPGVEHAHQIRTRGLAHHIFVDLSIHVKSDISIEEAHRIAHEVEHLLKNSFQGVKDVVVHLEPEGHRD